MRIYYTIKFVQVIVKNFRFVLNSFQFLRDFCESHLFILSFFLIYDSHERTVTDSVLISTDTRVTAGVVEFKIIFRNAR